MYLDRHLSIAILLASSALGWMHSGMGENCTSSVPALARSLYKAQPEAKTWLKPFLGLSCNPCTMLCKPSRSPCLRYCCVTSLSSCCIVKWLHALLSVISLAAQSGGWVYSCVASPLQASIPQYLADAVSTVSPHV